jgi:hypothetical protein
MIGIDFPGAAELKTSWPQEALEPALDGREVSQLALPDDDNPPPDPSDLAAHECITLDILANFTETAHSTRRV